MAPPPPVGASPRKPLAVFGRLASLLDGVTAFIASAIGDGDRDLDLTIVGDVGDADRDLEPPLPPLASLPAASALALTRRLLLLRRRSFFAALVVATAIAAGSRSAAAGGGAGCCCSTRHTISLSCGLRMSEPRSPRPAEVSGMLIAARSTSSHSASRAAAAAGPGVSSEGGGTPASVIG